jgi:hypothetical protein
MDLQGVLDWDIRVLVQLFRISERNVALPNPGLHLLRHQYLLFRGPHRQRGNCVETLEKIHVCVRDAYVYSIHVLPRDFSI